MKKKIALFLAAAMALTTLPTVAFAAATDNNISRVVSVEENYKLVDLENYPELILRSKEGTPFKVGDTITLELDNAEWQTVKAEDIKLGVSSGSTSGEGMVRINQPTDTTLEITLLKTGALGEGEATSEQKAALTKAEGDLTKAEGDLTKAEGDLAAAEKALEDDDTGDVDGALAKAVEEAGAAVEKAEADVEKAEADVEKAEADVDGATSDDVFKRIFIYVPMNVEVLDAGEATVTIPRDSAASSGTYTFARIGTGATTTKVASKESISESGTGLGNIIISEVTVGSLNTETEIKLKAPSNYEWKRHADVTFGGGLARANENIYYDDVNEKYVGYTVEEDGNELTIKFTPDAIKGGSTIGSVVIKDLRLIPTDDANYGTVRVTISGKNKVSRETLEVGTYKDYGVTFEAADKDLPVILSGQFPGSALNDDVTNEDDVETLQLKIEETIAKSLFGGRTTKITVPDGIEIRGAIIRGTKNGTDNTMESDKDKSDNRKTFATGKLNSSITSADFTLKDNALEFKMETKSTDTAEFYVTLFISAEPGYTGDVVATLSGGGLTESMTATIAKVEAPVSVSMKQTDIQIGYRNITVNDITITENRAGAIRKTVDELVKSGSDYDNKSKADAMMVLQIEDGDDLRFDSIKSYEVTSGDIDIDSVKVKGGQLQLTVKSESETPSTIVLKGITMNVNRTPAEGFYPLYVGGTAIIDNYDEKDGSDIFGYFEEEWFEMEKAFSVVTAAPNSRGDRTFVQLTIDSTTMQVGSQTITMDVAPYISNGRTMLPIKFVANAFGINNEQIKWEPNTKTVTIITSTKTIQLVVGSDIMTVNGTPLKMDVATEVKDGRTCLPLTWIATGLGVDRPVWNESARTVTFNADAAQTSDTTAE